MKCPKPVPRRVSGAWITALLALALPASRTLAGAPVDTATVAGPTRTVAFDTDEFTNARVDVSPDGRNMAFDVLGDLYTAPTTGGDARPLTAGSAWDARPRYSPDGKRIAFVSDRGGVATQWVVNADGSGAAEYSSAEQGWVSEVTPAWTAQGGLLEIVSPGVLREVFALGKSRAAGAHIDARAARGAFSLDGRYVYVGGTSITRVDLNSGERLDLGLDGKLGTALRLRVSRDGSRLFYQTALASWNEEVCGLRVRELSTGMDKPVTDAFDCAYADFALVPDASAVIAIQRGKFVRIDLSSGLQSDIPVRVHVQRELAPLARYTSRRIVDGGDISTRVIRWPTEPVEGNRVVFGAFGKIYVKDFKGGPPRRLTTDTASEFAPALSPDGKWVVYTTWSDAKMGQVMLVPLAGGRPRPLTTEAGSYLNPTWSPDGSRVAFLSDETLEARQGRRPQFVGPVTGQWLFSVKWVFVRGLSAPRGVQSVSPLAVYSNRFHPTPTFSADGTRLFLPTFRRPQDDDAVQGPVLISAALNGSDVRTIASLPPADEVVASPDNRQVAVVWQGGLYLSSLPSPGGPTASLDLANARRVTRGAVAHVSWRDASTVVWASSNRIYQYRIGDAAPELRAELDVRRARAEPKGCFALIHTRLVTMRGDEVIEDGSVLVCGNRIKASGSGSEVSIPGYAKVFDLRGSTIIPGLMDVHSHTLLNLPMEMWQRQNFNSVGNLAYGVTTLYDPSAPTLDVFGQAEMIDAGESVGPRIFSSGLPILSDPSNSNLRDVRSLDDARIAVDAVVQYGAGPVKEYVYARRDQVHWLAAAAREAGVSITTHSLQGSLPDILTHVVEGYTALEHQLSTLPLYRDVTQFVAASGTQNTPTLIVSPGFGDGFRLATDFAAPKLRRLYPPALIERERLANTAPGLEPAMAARERATVHESQNLAKIVRDGGLISIGAHGNGIPGLASHWEMWAFTFGGMSNHQALRAATLNGAKKLDLESDLGSIEAGKLADLVVLNSNPLDNIRNSADIRYVVKNGFLYDAETMTQLWPERRELQPWPWQGNQNSKQPEHGP